MLIYYSILVLLIFLCKFQNDKNKKKIVYFVMIILSLIAGLRHYTIGNDTENYYENFLSTIIYGKKIFKISRFEIGYKFVVYVFTLITKDFNIYLVMISLFINILIGKFILNFSKNPIYSIILFILMRFFFAEMNILRQFIAMAIIVYSTKFIKERNLLKYSISVYIASLFHSSAIFMFIFYFLYELKLNKKTYIISIITTIFSFVFLENILIFITKKIGIYQGYVDEYINSNKIGSWMSLFVSLTLFLFIIIIRRKCKDNKDDKIGNWLFNINYFTLLINFISLRISVFSRINSYFEIFYIVSITNYIYNIKNAKNRLMVYIIISLCFLCYFLVITYVRPNWNYVNPYRFFWR